jgi:hypothetical protein
MASFYERRPGLGPADPVDPQTAALLELLDGSFGERAEPTRSVIADGQVDDRQPPLEVLNALPADAPLQRELA